MTEQQYQTLKNRLSGDREFLILMLDGLRLYLLSKVGEWIVDILLWVLGKVFSYGRLLIWPLVLYLEAKGYINLGDGIMAAIKEALK